MFMEQINIIINIKHIMIIKLLFYYCHTWQQTKCLTAMENGG